MAFNFSQLITQITFEETFAEILNFLEDGGIDTSDWAPGNPNYVIAQTIAWGYYNAANRNRDAILSLNNQTSSGSALTLLADNWFDNQRFGAARTVGKIIVTGSAAADLPKTFFPKEFSVTDGTYVYKNINQFTINNTTTPYVTESFEADDVGAAPNISANSALTPLTTQIGFSVSNPPFSGSVSGSWITTFGKDAESDKALILRNKLKWTTLQIGIGTEDHLSYLALSASQTNTNVGIDDSQADGPGIIKVYLASDTTTATSSSVAAAQLVFNQVYPFNSAGEAVKAIAATPKEFDRTITIYYSPIITTTVNIQNEVFSTLNAWVSDVKIGGNDYLPFAANIASITDLIRDLESIQYVEKVSIQNAATDIALEKFEKLTAPSDWNSVVSFVRLNNL